MLLASQLILLPVLMLLLPLLLLFLLALLLLMLILPLASFGSQVLLWPPPLPASLLLLESLLFIPSLLLVFPPGQFSLVLLWVLHNSVLTVVACLKFLLWLYSAAATITTADYFPSAASASKFLASLLWL
jgi:hypothetical protein